MTSSSQSQPVSALLGADFDDYLNEAMRGEPLPHLIPGERINCLPEKRFAWLPCRLSDYSWTWMSPIWAWSVTQRWMIHPLTVTLYSRRSDGALGRQDGPVTRSGMNPDLHAPTQQGSDT